MHAQEHATIDLRASPRPDAPAADGVEDAQEGGFFRRNALAIACFTLFLVFLAAQAATGWHVFNEDAETHQQAAVGFGQYLSTGHFFEATFENWGSEFLQMFAFVLLTIVFRQKGSPESKPVHAPLSATGSDD